MSSSTVQTSKPASKRSVHCSLKGAHLAAHLLMAAGSRGVYVANSAAKYNHPTQPVQHSSAEKEKGAHLAARLGLDALAALDALPSLQGWFFSKEGF